MAETYLIRPVTETDGPLLASWRGRDHVRRWWGAPDVEPDADQPGKPDVARWIAAVGGRPFAFIQDYAVADWSPHPLEDLPPGSRGLDLYIGEETELGQGHGPRVLRQRVDRLFAHGVPAVGTDPHPDNARARRAFARAGFVTMGGPLDTPWGRAVLMHRFA